MKLNLLLLKTLLCFTFLILSCNNYNKDKIRNMLNSEDKNDQMEAIYLIGENRDSFFVDDLLKMANDPRISHKMKFLGMSIHQGCMGALRKITQQIPPNEIGYEVDTVNINFYKVLFKPNK
jgi:hypothetical protein